MSGMLYLWPCHGSMADFGPRFGCIVQPASECVPVGVREGRLWAMDNGCFGGEFRKVAFCRQLERMVPWREQCLFVTVPDVLYDARATLRLWSEWAHWVGADWPLAYVAQDGAEELPFPAGCRWVFIGGSDVFKLGPAGWRCIERAHEVGLAVHVGRVNSQKRWRYFARGGMVRSVDGTGPAREPDHYKRLLSEVMDQFELDSPVPGGHCGG